MFIYYRVVPYSDKWYLMRNVDHDVAKHALYATSWPSRDAALAAAAVWNGDL